MSWFVISSGLRTIYKSFPFIYYSTRKKGTFKILGLQQVAIGGTSKERLLDLWEGLMGVPRVGCYKSEKENVNEDILRLGTGPNAVEIDLMEPLDPSRSPKVHVPPLNHIGLWVDDLAAAVNELSGKGVRFTPGGIRKGAAGHDVAFIHPKGEDPQGSGGDGPHYPRGGEGVLIELVQATPEILSALSPDRREA